MPELVREGDGATKTGGRKLGVKSRCLEKKRRYWNKGGGGDGVVTMLVVWRREGCAERPREGSRGGGPLLINSVVSKGEANKPKSVRGRCRVGRKKHDGAGLLSKLGRGGGARLTSRSGYFDHHS